MKIAIAGASGLVGSALIPRLEADGAEIIRLVRNTPRANEVEWHPNQDEIDPAKLDGFDAVINLAGEPIAEGRWTAEKKQRIRDSRVKPTTLLSEALAGLKAKPKTFICAGPMRRSARFATVA